MTYRPHEEQREILEWSLQKVRSVPYQVSLRWLFYQLMQEKGLSKDYYNKFKYLLAKARKAFYGGWTPETLDDDSRTIEIHGYGFSSPRDWVASFKEKTCYLDKYSSQGSITVVMFEAQAMLSQFQHYSAPFHVILIPYKGDASIDLKWRTAKLLEQLHSIYQKPINAFYYGDLDPKGIKIPESAIKDIRSWCKVPINYRRIGLMEEHVKRWNIPENIKRPRQYQWEALSDAAAKELIEDTLSKFVDRAEIERVVSSENQATAEFNAQLDELLDTYYPEGQP